ncbi:MAG: hypothetical protein RJA61_514 [Candidatus Parcubacteria bacterium]|jgi:lysyl-tRNA synthetase class 2
MASLEELRDVRLAKLQKLIDAGINPYPITSKQDYELSKIVDDFSVLAEKGEVLNLTGRIMAMRPQGGLVFFDLFDGTAKLQAVFKKEEVEESIFNLFVETVDIGDIVGVSGSLFITKRGEKSIQVKTWTMLSKSLRPLPEKWHGLQDVEERFRRRYLDTLMNEDVRKRFITRSVVIKEIRNFLEDGGFLEVETPQLQHQAGGASALPFVTHHNALDVDLYLRIAPELYLKQLLIGGFPKVYEIGRNFRNEGIDVTHNPEFTMLEYYESWSDATKQRVFIEKLLKKVIKKVHGKTSFELKGEVIDFSKKIQVVSYIDLLKRHALVPNPEEADRAEWELKAKQLGVGVAPGEPAHAIMDSVYKKICRPKLIQPTFVVDYPIDYLPLAKKNEKNPRIVDAFQLVVGGVEIVKAFSELNDPIDQAQRFTSQEKNKEAGDKEAQVMNDEFVEALEYGMPPAGGVGVGIDRLVMLLTDTHNIREVILFPTLRQK